MKHKPAAARLRWYNQTMPSYTTQDLQAAAPAVLARLRALADFPDKGTVAGQSVASMFLEELGHDIRGQVNDIDVFVSMGMPRTDRGLEPLLPEQLNKPGSRKQGTTFHFNDVSSETDYEHVKFIALRSSVNILRTYRVGLVNYTLISSPLIPHGADGHNAAVSQAVVDGFDLNLVGVGINLETGRVVSSAGFLEFLNSGVVRVETCNTPAHTMVRLAKKVLGGEVMGAKCDYEGERRLLEVALACQQANEQDRANTPHQLWTVLSFGAHYKKLYDRFAHALPPLVERVETLHDGSEYTFYDMVPGELQHQCDVDLVKMAHGATALPYFCSQTVHVAQFPRFYELLHPERSLLDPEEIAFRRAAFDRIHHEAPDAENLHLTQKALGKPSLLMKIEGLDDHDSAAFFSNQACITDPELVRQVVEFIEDAPPIERHIIHGVARLRADEVLELSNDRSGVWRRMLAKSGRAIVSQVANCPFESEEAHRAPLLREIFTWLEELGPRGREIFQSMAIVQPKDCDHGLFLHTVVRCFPPKDQAALAARLLRKSLPSWPNLANETPEVAAAALSVWDGVRVPREEVAWTTAPSGTHAVLAELTCKRYRHSYSRDDEQDGADEMFDRVLPALSVEDISADNARIVRAMLNIAAGDKLITHLSSRQDVQQLLPSLCRIVDQWRESSEDLHDISFPFSNDPDADPWRRPYNPRPAVALLENMILACEAPGAAPAPASRRPRL